MTTAKLNSGVFSSASDEWATPAVLFALLNDEFRGFAVDVCASTENAKCARYWTMADNGLAQAWPMVERWPSGGCWMNPPYSQIGEWMRKAHESALAGSLVVCLVPARTDTRWWWSYAVPAEIRFLPGRLKFGGGDGKNSAPFPSAVIVMWPGLPEWGWRVRFWDWRESARNRGIQP